MKRFSHVLLALFAFVVAIAFSACHDEKKDIDPTELDAHMEYEPEAFRTSIDACKEAGKDYIIVDYRKKSQFNAGHIPGSVWLKEGSYMNMGDNSFANAIYAACGNSKRTIVYLVGPDNFALNTTMGGSISSFGFGQYRSIVLVGGFDAWKKMNETDPDKFPIEVPENYPI